MRSLLIGVLSICSVSVFADAPRVFPAGELPDDVRLSELRNLNGYFPFQAVPDTKDWPQRRDAIRRRILVSQGLWPLPMKSDLNAVIHGRVDRGDYVVDRVFFESIPGHYVTGSLYRPKTDAKSMPVILSPHGHWQDGRMYDAGEERVQAELESGGEKYKVGGRNPIQARAVQLARMGCMVFSYDMTGYADSVQLAHRPDDWSELDRQTDWGFFSAQAELHLQNMMGLQTWNSLRALDFVLELPETDPDRVGVTGASGGGTQSMILSAIDDRITASMPCVMVSTAMQGGCTCENAPYLRIDQGNIDIAAATAPRPLGITAADDWTIELESKGFPQLQDLYRRLGHPDRLTAAFNVQFKHNYNYVNRAVMYSFFNRHFDLGLAEPIVEGDYVPLTREEASVWNDAHPAPGGDAVGATHEARIVRIATEENRRLLESLIPSDREGHQEFRRVIGGAWDTLLARDLTDIGEVRFESVGESDQQGISIHAGRIGHAGTQLPCLVLSDPKTETKGTVVCVSDAGKADLFVDGTPRPIVAGLVHAGYKLIAADLLGQGEFVADGDAIESQPMWYQPGGDRGWRRFSGYTYGYNHPLFAKRVHDVLSLIKYAQTSGDGSVHLIGVGAQGGTIAAAARAQAADAVDRTFINPKGFRFADLTRQDDPMFLPGAVKYGDVEMLVALALPGRIDVVGAESAQVSRVAKSIGHESSVHWHDSAQALVSAIQDALIGDVR